MQTKIRTLIVDDMKLARNHIRQYLTNDAEIEIVGECGNGREAVKAITENRPDLVFLDVQMPGVDGFGVIEKIGVERMPAVIFVTAFDEFALKAFDANATDYLLKPFDEERLQRAVARAKREIARSQPGDLDERLRRVLEEVRPAQTPRHLKRIAVKNAEHTFILQTDDIDWIGAAGNYVELHVGRETHLVRERLSQLEQQLDPEKFVRVHRSTIVRIDRIKTLHPLFNDDHLIVLHNGVKLNASRTYNEKLLSLLNS
ncbi:MAG TPA: response regulator [Pyrinomonadaceae bacterium]